jgi:hypothetical protein
MWGPFPAGLIEACFLLQWPVHLSCFPDLQNSCFFSAHDCMLSTHRFILTFFFWFLSTCVYLGLRLYVLVCVCVHPCMLWLLDIRSRRMVGMIPLQTLK